MSRLAIARLVAAKDLRIEWRSRVLVNQVLPFGVIVLVLFAFALDNDTTQERVAPGLIGLATLFSVVLLVQRSFAVEAADRAIDALKVAGVDTSGIYLGKSAALAGELFVLQLLLTGGALVLYRSRIQGPAGGVLLVTTVLLASVGLAFVGTLYGGLAAGAKGRETLLPLLLLPVVAPVLIGANRALEASFGTGGTKTSQGWPWLGLLGVFAVAFGIGGALAFGPLIDDDTA